MYLVFRVELLTSVTYVDVSTVGLLLSLTLSAGSRGLGTGEIPMYLGGREPFLVTGVEIVVSD